MTALKGGLAKSIEINIIKIFNMQPVYAVYLLAYDAIFRDIHKQF